MQMTDVVNRRRMRHAHMVNITPEIMCEGMRADFRRCGPAEPEGDGEGAQGELYARDDGGGDGHSAELNPEYKWLKTSGIISREKWGNLPGGECFTAPGEVNGVFVVDGVVGDFLCARYGIAGRDAADD